jgi:hypothetical protein
MKVQTEPSISKTQCSILQTRSSSTKKGLLNLAEELCKVSKACQVMGYDRDTFYRYKSAVDAGGVDALF